jgi:hypothetical protein
MMGLDDIGPFTFQIRSDLPDCLLELSGPCPQSFAFYALVFGAENASIKVAKGGWL